MLITRCTACGTSFRLTLEQLDARGGKVRCGACRSVFDARESLRLADDDEPAPQQEAAPEPRREEDPAPADASPLQTAEPSGHAPEDVPDTRGEPVDAQQTSAPEITSPPDEHGTGEPQDSMGPGPSSGEDLLTADESPAKPEQAIACSEEPPEISGTPLAQDEPQSVRQSDAAADAPQTAEQDATPMPVREIAPATPTADEFGFGPAPERRRRTGLWATGCLLLVLVFAAQALFHWRGTISLLLPESKPYLEQACAALGCTLPLPRKPELMSIESSDLQGHPNNPAVMVLAATLRNRAPFPQDFPALELTLTDDRDKSLARRVLQPADYLGRDAEPGDGFAGNSERPVRVFLEASELRATGYRLYLFYP